MKRDLKKTLRNKADKLFQLVGLKNNPRCFVCGRKAEVIHHYIEKSLSNALRYDLANGCPLCFNCHCYWHSRHDPETLHKIDEKMGKTRLEYLREARKRKIKTNLAFYRQAVEMLENNK